MNRREIMKLITSSTAGAMASSMAAPGVSEASTPPPPPPYPGPGLRRRRVTTSDGVSLNVVETGKEDGPAIVFVHGISQAWQSWTKQLQDVSLRSRFRLIAFDLRGHGESEGAQGAIDEDGFPYALLPTKYYFTGDNVTTSQRWANDIAAVIGELGLDKPTLVGWSYGGVVVLDYLVNQGGLGAAGRVLIDAGNPALTDTGTAAGSLLFTPEGGDAIGQTVPPANNEQVAVGLTRFVQLCFRDDVRPPPPAEDVQFTTSFNLRTAPSTRLAIFQRRFDYRPFLAGLSAKTRAKIRALTPLNDHILQASTEITLWNEAHIVNEQIPNEGHLYHYRNWPAFDAKLAAFI